MSKRGGAKQPAPKAPEGRKASADIKGAYIGSTDLFAVVPVMVVFPSRGGVDDTVLSFDLALKGDNPFSNVSLREKVKVDILVESVPNRVFAKVSPETVVSFIGAAMARAQSVPKEIQPFAKYQRDPLPQLDALQKSGEGLGVGDDGASVDVLTQLLDSGNEYDAIDISPYLSAARVVQPSTYAVRGTWPQSEVDRWASTAQILLSSSTLAADLTLVAEHMVCPTRRCCFGCVCSHFAYLGRLGSTTGAMSMLLRVRWPPPPSTTLPAQTR
jgi:hypothetical protein